MFCTNIQLHFIACAGGIIVFTIKLKVDICTLLKGNGLLSATHFVNLLLLSTISFVGGGGRWAIVGEIRAGSLAFKSMALVTP